MSHKGNVRIIPYISRQDEKIVLKSKTNNEFGHLKTENIGLHSNYLQV